MRARGVVLAQLLLTEPEGPLFRPEHPDALYQAAREALNDLRLVIYSLDLGDSDLPDAPKSDRAAWKTALPSICRPWRRWAGSTASSSSRPCSA